MGARPRSAQLLLVLVVVVWAGAFAAIKGLLDRGVDAENVAIDRYLLAAPVFAVLLWRAGGLPGLTRRDAARLVAAGVLTVTVYHLALNTGERFTTAGTASVMIATAPAWTLVLALAVGLERFSARRAAGLALAFAGVVVVVVLGSGQTISFEHARGALLAGTAAIAFAAYTVIAKPLLDRQSALAVTAAAGLVGVLTLLPFARASTFESPASGAPSGCCWPTWASPRRRSPTRPGRSRCGGWRPRRRRPSCTESRRWRS